MDALLIPIAALAIPVAAIVFSGWQKVLRLRIEEARIRAGGGQGEGPDELQRLRGEVEQLRNELNEVQERLDFAERLLARPERDRPPDRPRG
jgi:hypothetical protein